MIAACTIVSPNYFAYARTLAASYLAHHPDQRFFVLMVADLALEERNTFERDAFTPVLLKDLGIADIKSVAMKYDILELNTNVKPSFMKYLIDTFDLEKLVYLDPDIFVYSPLTPVFDALDAGATATLTPHMTTPVKDGKLPSEQDMLYNGTYNLGFMAVRRCEESSRLLNWWEERCLEQGFSEGRSGLFVDQKWMNLAPGLFGGAAILRHAGCNMAYWNLHERSLVEDATGWFVQGADGIQRLCFFHFSGVVITDQTILSKNSNRFTLAERPDLQKIFREYKAAVVANRDAVREAVPYGFDQLTDGTTVTRLARRIYSKHQARWQRQDPFDAKGEFAAFAKRLGLVDGRSAAQKSTWREFNPKDRRVEMVHYLLRLALRLLGPNRYELLMRYLAHITVLRNQSVFLDDK